MSEGLYVGFFVTKWHNIWKMYKIKIWNCGLLSYGTMQCKWSAQMIWHGPTASIMLVCVDRPRKLLQNIHNHVMYQTIRCPNSDHVTNPHHCEHLISLNKYGRFWSTCWWNGLSLFQGKLSNLVHSLTDNRPILD